MQIKCFRNSWDLHMTCFRNSVEMEMTTWSCLYTSHTPFPFLRHILQPHSVSFPASHFTIARVVSFISFFLFFHSGFPSFFSCFLRFLSNFPSFISFFPCHFNVFFFLFFFLSIDVLINIPEQEQRRGPHHLRHRTGGRTVRKKSPCFPSQIDATSKQCFQSKRKRFPPLWCVKSVG